MYWVTESGGWNGTLIIVVIISIAFALVQSTIAQQAWSFFRMLFILVVTLGSFAILNEQIIKPAFGISRPSHVFILQQANSTANLDSIYSLVLQKRRIFFKEVIKANTLHFKTYDPRVLDNWVDEAGYSLPSGHSFNAFLLASIVAFSIYELSGRRVTLWSYLPLLWAALVGLSRVALGSHSPLDVMVGAGLGLVVSHMLLAWRVTRKLLIPAFENRTKTVH